MRCYVKKIKAASSEELRPGELISGEDLIFWLLRLVYQQINLFLSINLRQPKSN